MMLPSRVFQQRWPSQHATENARGILIQRIAHLGSTLDSTRSAFILHHIDAQRTRSKDGTKFGAVIIINDGSRALNSRYKRACRIGQWTERTPNVTHGCFHTSWLRHTRTRETLVPTGHQRLAPPAHRWTFNMRIYFCHAMSQQIKRSGLGDVPCLCSALQRTLNLEQM